MAGWSDSIASEARVLRKPKTPKGYDSDADFLKEMRERYEFAYTYNEHNVLAGQEDAKFTVGDQWDSRVAQKRRDARKPVLTFNRLVAFMAQIIGNRLMNETEIRVWPDKSGTKEVAELRQGLIRSIYKNSDADFARDEAHKYQVVGGQGAFYLAVDYAGDDVFEQKISLKACPDPYAAVFDPMAIEPSGKDGQVAWVGEDLPKRMYEKRWPWASIVSFSDQNKWNSSGYWCDDDTVRIVSYWQMVVEGVKTLALYKDGTVHDVSEMEEYEYSNYVETRDDGQPYIREVPRRFARLYVCSGSEILEGPYDYPVSSLPVYRVPGWELNDGEKIHRWGLIRFLKDPQRLHNYWRSTVAEQLVAAPRNKWLATPDSIKGHEAKWRSAPSSDNPFLYYNDGETAPIHIPPPGIDAALVNEAGVATQDMKDISNIHEASLGMPSNEVSKVAIQQRQMATDVGTFIYSDRLRIADERCAVNINELIPYIYDTKRMITIIGNEDKMMVQMINDPTQPNNDITMGKYGITVAIGPATATKRALAAEQMMAFVNAAPETAAGVMDLIADAQDWPKSGEFARRFRMALPAGMIPEDEMTDEMKAVQAQNQQQQQMQQQIIDANNRADLAVKEKKAALDEARARLAESQAYKAIADANARTMDVDGKNSERDFNQTMGMLDQHNSLEHEDRTFALQEKTAETAAKSSGKNGEQK